MLQWLSQSKQASRRSLLERFGLVLARPARAPHLVIMDSAADDQPGGPAGFGSNGETKSTQGSSDSRRLTQLAYRSRATRPLAPRELEDILTVARIRNAVEDVTGCLLHADGWFLQVLEGKQAALEELIVKIALDPRHDEVSIIFQRTIAQRHFPHWRMGFHNLPAPHRAAWRELVDRIADCRGDGDAIVTLIDQTYSTSA
jgi:hypothetical protein